MFNRFVLDGFLIFLAIFGVVAAQSVSPTNQTTSRLSSNESQHIGLELMSSNSPYARGILNLIPLVDGARTFSSSSGLRGSIFRAAPGNFTQVTSGEIAWISCDSQDYERGNLGAIQVFQGAVSNRAVATIFYSVRKGSCNYRDGDGIGSAYRYIYSMDSTSDAESLGKFMNYVGDKAEISALSNINFVDRLAGNSTRDGSGSGQEANSPSTAVAMIILYSITGVITALFLIIIVTGAIRAHRHPERYGPRAVLGRGRVRQSRAKGLARAMLDSIPIVKFGEQEEGNAKPNDVELATSRSSTVREVNNGEELTAERKSMDPTERAVVHDDGPASATPRRSMESGIGANVATPTSKPVVVPDEPLGCSICTEDFERGEDMRVLPCDHKFHPACIDPWLLNVSGTCPLCRIDLRPPTAGAALTSQDQSDDAASTPETSTSDTPGLTPAQRPLPRLSDILLDLLNRRRMQEATPEERIRALRQYRQRSGGNSAEGTTESRRRRMSVRMSNLFRSPSRSAASGANAVDETVASPSETTHPLPSTAENETSSSTTPNNNTTGGASRTE